MTTAYKVTISYTMANGSNLEVCWNEARTSGGYWEPDEVEQGESEIFIDGDEVAYEKLPKGLHTLVDLMESDPYNNKFHYSDEFTGRLR